MKESFATTSVSPYEEALRHIRRHPGTGGAGSLAKLILSLYNDMCGFSFAECVGNLDDNLTDVAIRMVTSYAKHGATDDLRDAGKIIADDLYPRLWEMSRAMHEARAATRDKWQEEDRKADQDALNAAEAALFTDPAKLVAVPAANGLLEVGDSLYAYYQVAGDWRNVSLTRDSVQAAIDLCGGGELSGLCPENSQTLAVRMDNRVYYVSTNYDKREAYLESIGQGYKPIPRRIDIPPRDSAN